MESCKFISLDSNPSLPGVAVHRCSVCGIEIAGPLPDYFSCAPRTEIEKTRQPDSMAKRLRGEKKQFDFLRLTKRNPLSTTAPTLRSPRKEITPAEIEQRRVLDEQRKSDRDAKRRAASDAKDAKLIAYIAKRDGATYEEIRLHSGCGCVASLLPERLRRLVSEGRLSVEGEGRDTEYSVISQLPSLG